MTAFRARIDGDQPFLTEERRRRVDTLDTLLADPGVTVSEKFRKTMEALMVEAEYGRTIEVYQDTITVDGQPLLATSFAWDASASSSRPWTTAAAVCSMWRPEPGSLPPSFDNALQTAIDIGAKRQPVELLSLPLGRMAAP